MLFTVKLFQINRCLSNFVLVLHPTQMFHWIFKAYFVCIERGDAKAVHSELLGQTAEGGAALSDAENSR